MEAPRRHSPGINSPTDLTKATEVEQSERLPRTEMMQRILAGFPPCDVPNRCMQMSGTYSQKGGIGHV
jgi:hypothetical protein